MHLLQPKLPGVSAQAYDPRVLAQMRADTMNKTAGDMTGYDCPRCMNRGVSYYIDDRLALVGRECSCMHIRRCLRKIADSGMGRILESCTFDTFRPEQPWQAQLLDLGRQYAARNDGWLLLCGQSGCGKTHICSAVCRELMLTQDQQVIYMLWRTESARIKDLAQDADARQQRKELFKKAQVLYIDDLFKTGGQETLPSAADIGLAFEILNHRYISGLRTIISTERSPQQLVELDEALGSRIIEQAGQWVFYAARDRAKNYRMRHVKSC